VRSLGFAHLIAARRSFIVVKIYVLVSKLRTGQISYTKLVDSYVLNDDVSPSEITLYRMILEHHE
jgi:hypothetical protein